MKRIACWTVFIFLLLFTSTAFAASSEVDNYDGRFAGARIYWDAGGYTRDLMNNNAYRGTYSQQVTYDKAGFASSYIGYDIGSGFDFSMYDTFSFMVYSVLNNTQIEITLMDDGGDEMRYSALTVNQGAGWQRMSWDLTGGTEIGSFEWNNVRRIFFYVWNGNGTATGTFRMDEIQFTTSTLATPAINAPITDPDQDGTYTLTWPSVPGAALYEVWTENGSMFVNANSNTGSGWQATWPNTSTADITVAVDDTYHNKVRAWTAAPGAGGACSYWSDTEAVTIAIVAPAPTPPAPAATPATGYGSSSQGGCFVESVGE